MEKRKLGKSDLMLAPLVFGGNVFGWTIDESTSFNLLDAFSEAGFNAIDTANTYSMWKKGNTGGESETIIGNWLKRSGKRKDMLIFTKVGSQMSDGTKGLSDKNIIEQAEKSLKRLQTDHIDLYFSHHDDLATSPEETMNAYQKLIKEGKVRYIGASNFKPERMEESMRISVEKELPQYVAIQPKYNMYDRDFEKTDVSVVEEFGLGVVTYWSLASGFLTGKYTSDDDLTGKTRHHAVKGYMDERGRGIIKELEKLSKETGNPISTLALAWILKNPLVTAPIASATSIDQLKDLMKISDTGISKVDFD